MVILALSEARLREGGRVCVVELLVEKSKECKRKRLSALAAELKFEQLCEIRRQR